MSGLQMILAASAAVAALALAALAITARRSRGLDEPTDLLPLFDEDPIARAFNEAERILRGDTDEDFARLYDRRVLRPYEDELQTVTIRRLARRLSRLDH